MFTHSYIRILGLVIMGNLELQQIRIQQSHCKTRQQYTQLHQQMRSNASSASWGAMRNFGDVAPIQVEAHNVSVYVPFEGGSGGAGNEVGKSLVPEMRETTMRDTATGATTTTTRTRSVFFQSPAMGVSREASDSTLYSSGSTGSVDSVSQSASRWPVEVTLPRDQSGMEELGLGSYNSAGSITPKGRRILREVSLCVPAGQLLAIMGGSGSGKTTLLNALAGRAGKVTIEGDILYNGNPSQAYIERGAVAYVQQFDYLLPCLTVRETLRYAARLRLPREMSKREKYILVESAIVELGLKECADTMIGDEWRKGISGGERRRVSVAVQLLINPSVIFMDEPTTGLDAWTSHSLIKTLSHLCRNGRTIIISIHQPRSSTFSLFHSVALLSKGDVVYCGPAQDATNYFAGIGHPIPDQMNPAEFLIDITSVDNRDQETEARGRARLNGLIEAWRMNRDRMSIRRPTLDRSRCTNRRRVADDASETVEVVSTRSLVGSLDRSDKSLPRPKDLSSHNSTATNSPLNSSILDPSKMQRLSQSLARIASGVQENFPPPSLNQLRIDDDVEIATPKVSFENKSPGLTPLRNPNDLEPTFGSTSNLSYFSGDISSQSTVVSAEENTSASSNAQKMDSLESDSSLDSMTCSGCPNCASVEDLSIDELMDADLPIYHRTGFLDETWILLHRSMTNLLRDRIPILFIAINTFLFIASAAVLLEYYHPVGSPMFDLIQSLIAKVGLKKGKTVKAITGINETGIPTLKRSGTKSRRGQKALPMIEIRVENLKMTLVTKKNKGLLDKDQSFHTLLDGVSAVFETGKITAIMGSSGAGKTTLLSSLMARFHLFGSNMARDGHVYYGGHELAPADVSQLCSYVCQDDTHHLAALTARETMHYAALLRLPGTMSRSQKIARAEEVLLELGLKDCADNKVGDELIKGLSGGEKRRLSIAIAILTDPRVLVLDEPTSGLDSFNSRNVIASLKKIAESGRTIICTIHQPTSDLFTCFDSILLLARGGRVTYSGPTERILPHFAALGHAIPPLTNPFDFVVDLASIDLRSPRQEHTSKERVNSLVKAWKDIPRPRTPKTNSMSRERGKERNVWFPPSVEKPAPGVGASKPVNAGMADDDEVNSPTTPTPLRPSKSRKNQNSTVKSIRDLTDAPLDSLNTMERRARAHANVSYSDSLRYNNTSAHHRHHTQDLIQEVQPATSELSNFSNAYTITPALVAYVPPPPMNVADLKIERKISAGFFRTCAVLISRDWKNTWRQPQIIYAKLITAIFFSIVNCIYLYHLDESQVKVQAKFGALHLFSALVFLGMMSNLSTFPSSLALYRFDKYDQAYSLETFMFATFVTEIPFEIVCAFFHAVISCIYGLRMTQGSFIVFFYCAFAMMFTGESFGMSFTALTPNTTFLVQVMSGVITLMTLLSGFLGTHPPAIIEKLNYLSVVKYSSLALGLAEFKGTTIDCNGPALTTVVGNTTVLNDGSKSSVQGSQPTARFGSDILLGAGSGTDMSTTAAAIMTSNGTLGGNSSASTGYAASNAASCRFHTGDEVLEMLGFQGDIATCLVIVAVFVVAYRFVAYLIIKWRT
ncbi:hypothetical protein HDU76_013893 [Blyttiomyces sp. JEL0837]|nr:hypothetical protein HDU76_013893 [Blyttiomyces sp. JEL0837]